MTTILFFPFNLLSHYLRCLVLADSYDKRTHNILFLSSSTYDKYVIEHGFERFNCEQFDSDHVMNCSKNFDFSWLNEIDIERIVAAQISAIINLKADMVVGDTAPSLKMAAEYTNVSYVALMNGYMTKYYSETRQVPKMHRAYKLLSELPVPVSNGITGFAERITFRKIHKPFRTLRKKYNLKPVNDYISELEGDENLICDLPELFPQKTLPGNYKFTGPLIYQYKTEEANWLNELPNKPIICVCMGSTGDWKKLSFLNDPYYAKYLIIAAGDLDKVLYADHIISKDFVNLTQVLRRTSLLICHGGNGTIYSGIMAGVFMICLSNNFEQEWNLKALEKYGYGKSADRFDDLIWREEIENAVKKAIIIEIPIVTSELV